ncbi:MAG: hypothetical protein WAV20_06755 [Blastocatellia bacterium]
MKRTRLGLAVMLAIGFSTPTVAGQMTFQQSSPKPGQSKTPQKPVTEPIEKTDAVPQEPDDAMRRALTALASQIGLLTDEVQKLRRETERNSGMMELLLNEDRLAKVEDKIQDAANQKAQLDAREQDIQRRLRNIQGELILRGGLRREDAETAIRNELQRALEDVRNQQGVCQQRITELNDHAARLRARVETLRKKVEQSEQKSGREEK